MGQRGVAAGADDADLAAGEALAQLVGAGEGRGAGRLGQGMGPLDHPDHGLHDLLLLEEHEVVEQLPEDGLGHGEAAGGGEALGEGGVRRVDYLAATPGLVGGGRGCGLHADHLDPRVDGLGD